MPYHHPVLLESVLELLTKGIQAGWIIDATSGGGGHGIALIEHTPDAVHLLALDRDPQAVEASRRRLSVAGPRATVVAGRFGDVVTLAERVGAAPAVGLLADLGVSSAQLDRPERGFSLRGDGPLDMDMENRGQDMALRLLERIDRRDLAEALRDYGDIPRPGMVARVLVEEARRGRLHGTRDLAEVVARQFPWLRKGNRHAATRVFQVLRMLVNEEVEQLDALLDSLPDLLAPGGTAAVIAYHSAEDRRVKHRFRDLARRPDFELRTRRPLYPSEAEISGNPRARSARLRALRRLPAEAGP